MNKSDVKTIDDLAEYLIGVNRDSKLYHYTTYENLLCILNNKSFRMTSTDLLNDKKEKEFSSGNKSFVISMTGDKEYISMWSMYGKPSGIKIRIDFSKSEFKKCLKRENVYSDIDLTSGYFPLTKSLVEYTRSDVFKECSLCSVAYLERDKGHFKHNSNPFNDVAVNELSLNYLSGLVKYEAWEFEKEIRARVFMFEDKQDYVYLKLSDDFIDSIRVTFNPWLSPELKNAIRNDLKRYGIECRDSDYDGQIDEL